MEFASDPNPQRLRATLISLLKGSSWILEEQESQDKDNRPFTKILNKLIDLKLDADQTSNVNQIQTSLTALVEAYASRQNVIQRIKKQTQQLT